MDLKDLIVEQELILMPVLYVLGMFIKSTKIKDKYIPMILLIIGIVLSFFILGFNVQAFIQGVFVTGTTVFGNQIVKQLGKEE
jgi:multidrug transporter EmrE-like cation transporter